MEFLYPEKDYLWNGKKGVEDTAPENIKQAVIRLWSWIQACVPSGADPSSMTTEEVRKRFVSSKFKAELAQYFNPENLALWWVWTDYTMAVDQRVKNTFFRTWDAQVWYLTYYDGDTSMGKRNDAFLAYLYNISRDTRDLQRNKYAFEGHSSRLWALVLANMEVEIKAAATMMRTALTDAVFRRVYNHLIMDNWSERQYNKSGINKYIRPTYTDYNGTGVMNYIFALNGTMYAYRNQLIDRRFSLLDARYEVGAYHSDAVQGYIGKGAVATQIKATAGDEYYFGWRTQNGQFRQHQGVPTGGVATFDFPDAISQNDPVRLIGASRMRKIDFATTAPFLQGAWNFNGCRGLEELIAPVSSGKASQWYPLLSKITGLKHIDLTGQSGVTGTEDEQARTFNIASHTGLTSLKLRGTKVQGIRIGAGSPLTRLELPESLSYLRLRSLPKLSMEGLVLDSWASVRSLELAGCPKLDWRTLLNNCSALERLRIEGVELEDDGKLLERLSHLKGIDANGSGVGLTLNQVQSSLSLRGLVPLSYDAYKDIINLFYAKYGNRRSQDYSSSINYEYSGQYPEGQAIITGIHDIEDALGGAVIEHSGIKTVIPINLPNGRKRNKLMGLENINGGGYVHLDKATCTEIGQNRVLNIQSQRSVPYTRSDRYYDTAKHLTHQRYMDILSANGETDTSRILSSATYYSSCGIEALQGNTLLVSNHRENDERSAYQLINFVGARPNETNTRETVRAMYQGEVVEVNNPEEFKKLSFI